MSGTVKQLTLYDGENDLPNNVAKTPVVITNQNGDDIRGMLLNEGRVDGSSITIEGGRLAVKVSNGEDGLPTNIVHGESGLYVRPAQYPYGDLDMPEKAETTVTPDQFNRLTLTVTNLIAALQSDELLEKHD